MREFKLRAWSENAKKMIYMPRYLIACENGYSVATLDYNSKNKEAIEYKVDDYLDGGLYPYPSKLMEYTGLKDENGKEIYEGDIVLVSGWDYDGAKQKYHTVYWDEQILCFRLEGYEGEDKVLCMLSAFACKIIGNIYEEEIK